ncbi:hypothetical protein C4544_07220 [candidate division WS5 bacterium]|uniref:Nucleoside 2-deoxyribosyltransferase n=1 Tax=candidate division WS5 bacterium TaxID=2093353 RepID=A0A419DAE8_9BACT|nr:MAG: hypothetical protein C4544_07220 [candidate division WS5 bacterium]
MKKVYLAGLAKEYAGEWKERIIREVPGFEYHDWEIDSDQTSPDTFFPDDLKGIKAADILVANPGTTPCEGTWIEVGYFLANNTEKPGDTCDRLIIIWPKDRSDWSLEFVEKAGIIVESVDEAIEALKKLK